MSEITLGAKSRQEFNEKILEAITKKLKEGWRDGFYFDINYVLRNMVFAYVGWDDAIHVILKEPPIELILGKFPSWRPVIDCSCGCGGE